MCSAELRTFESIAKGSILAAPVVGVGIEFNRSELIEALEAGSIKLFLQPIIDMVECDIIGVEALCRWDHTEGLLYPSSFLLQYRTHDLLYELDTYVISEAFKVAARWLADGIDVPISINVDGATLSHPMFLSSINQLVKSYGINPGLIKIELSESKCIEQRSREATVLSCLQSMGFKLSLDDFGSGCSSLSYLLYLNPDQVKLDKIFTESITTLDTAEACYSRLLLQLVINIVRGKEGVELVAEGVETEYQSRLLQDMGCCTAQGWLYSKAQPVHVVEDMIRKKRSIY